MNLLTALVALSLSAEPVLNNQIKDAIAQPPPGEKKAVDSKHPDVEKLPFSPDSIKAVVTSWQPDIQACYEEHLADKKKAVEGKILTSFVITAEGTVKKQKVEAKKKETTLKDPGLHSCVSNVLAGMSFPKPPDGKDHPIEFPFNLKAIQ